MNPVSINLGSGNRKFSHYINIDHDESTQPDIVADLNKEIPLDDNMADRVYSSHVIEHVDDIFHFMKEIWRISKNGAQVMLIAPYYMNWIYSIQPNHKRFIKDKYFQMWEPEEHQEVKNRVMNEAMETKGAVFHTIRENLINGNSEIVFLLEVIK